MYTTDMSSQHSAPKSFRRNFPLKTAVSAVWFLDVISAMGTAGSCNFCRLVVHVVCLLPAFFPFIPARKFCSPLLLLRFASNRAFERRLSDRRSVWLFPFCCGLLTQLVLSRYQRNALPVSMMLMGMFPPVREPQLLQLLPARCSRSVLPL